MSERRMTTHDLYDALVAIENDGRARNRAGGLADAINLHERTRREYYDVLRGYLAPDQFGRITEAIDAVGVDDVAEYERARTEVARLVHERTGVLQVGSIPVDAFAKLAKAEEAFDSAWRDRAWAVEQGIAYLNRRPT